MAKRSIQPCSPEEMRTVYPIQGQVDGWYFRRAETSNGAWFVEGSDAWGRRVSRSGSDPDVLLNECICDARGIVAQVLRDASK
jgi:hypothetical protein